MRQNTTSWNAAYQPYVSAIIDSVKPNQVTEGGPILRTYSVSSELPHISESQYPMTVVQVGSSCG